MNSIDRAGWIFQTPIVFLCHNMMMSSIPVIPFNSPDATLQTAGGKGLNLVRLTRAGFPVPPGFLVSTEAYRAFVATNQLHEKIQAAIKNLTAEDMQALERVSGEIRATFSAGTL